jgi:hypothetical protein
LANSNTVLDEKSAFDTTLLWGVFIDTS